MENNTKKLNNWFLHIDLDAFFASVEQLDNPAYRGRPVIVGGRKDDKRGVVSTASYEARKFGVHSAMPIFQAVKLCPDGIYLRTRMERYVELSCQIMNIFNDFSPDVEQMSIDEAFIDLTGTEQLFGPPEKTALKIKKRVKEVTGLTVSIGLASTKYLAKIASDYSKPDGFYFIKPGQEQIFMLSLPINKVWGLGPMTLEKLKKAGLFTTRDIYNKSLDILQFLFGPTMASFLYNVVRGEEKDTFSKKVKSHSISSEKTFSHDISDIYTAETELLELAHEVIFRLLREEKFSRTVTVKIKYDDFTYVTIQRTFDQNITTVDSFFEKIKNLFEEKYQHNRRIRLLGVGFDKVESFDKPFQQSLFNTKEDKKNTVERTILDIKKKHPEIKIQKARLLKLITVIFILLSQFILFPAKTQKLYGNDYNSNTLKTDYYTEDKGLIFNWDINDKNHVVFDIFGHWKFDLTGNISGTFGKDIPFVFSPQIPVFKQDIELSSIFKLNKKWYFESNFADNFSNNTISIGYNGDKYFRSGKISNRNITMPGYYSSEQFGLGLSGGANQAPGISANWEGPYKINDNFETNNSGKWKLDFLLRYDMTTPNSAVFYGMNKVTDTSINPENYLKSYSFIFPENTNEELKNIKNIYIESEHGTFYDYNGKSYKKLSISDYYYSDNENILYLSPGARNENQYGDKVPTVLITFVKSNFVESVIAATGTYENSSTFAGKIQSIFNDSYKKFNLSDFSYPLKTSIENTDALVIQNSSGFSPYVIANNYDCGINKNIEISVNSKNTNKEINDYVVEIQNNSYTEFNEDFIEEQHIYAKINNKNDKYGLFPFVKTNPEFYLNLPSDSDINIKLRTYNPVTNINIGQKASAGTIQITKNGMYISDFLYDINTGNINFFSPIKNNDQIRIVWQEEASDFSKGALAAGLGFYYNILPELNWDIAFTTKQPLIFDNQFSTPDNLQKSFIALSTGINFSKNNFLISDKASFSIEKQNASDKLLISPQNSYISTFYELNYFSGQETKCDIFLKNTRLMQKNNFTIRKHNGEIYNDKNGYKIPLEWDFSKASFEDIKNQPWAAVDIKLDNGNELKNSSRLKIKICIESDISNDLKNTPYRVYLQLGIKASSDYYNKSIPVFDITDKLDFQNKNWQTVTVTLSDKDRAHFVSDKDARIIIVPKKEISENNKKGKITIGAYSPIVESIFTIADPEIIVQTTNVPSEKKSYSSAINWIASENTNKDSYITATSRFSPSDFNNYKKINFKFAYENISHEKDTDRNKQKNPELIFILDTDSFTPVEDGQIAIKLELNNINKYINNIKSYHIVSINLVENIIYIDNIKINESDYTLYIDKSVVPSRLKYKINTTIGDKIIKNGTFYADNVTFEESDFSYIFQNNININYKKDEILKINNFPILENGFIKLNSSQKLVNNNFLLLSSLNSGITITGISFITDMLMKKNNITNIGYNIKTESPLFDIFSISESFRQNKDENFIQKTDNIDISFSKIKIPVTLKTAIAAKKNSTQKIQSHDTKVEGNFKIKENILNINSSFSVNQNINSIKNNNINISENNFFYNWIDILKLQFSSGEVNASSRNTSIKGQASIGINNNFVTPSAEYTLSSSYENIKELTFKDKTTLDIKIPFKLKKSSVSLNFLKTGGDISNNIFSTTYFSDLKELFLLQNKRKWFYTAIPFYELFDKNLSKNITGNYLSKYEIIYDRELSNSFKDLYIPSSISFSISRNIKSKDKCSNTYIINSSISNMSINNFGRNSYKKIFNFFAQEEINSKITGTVKIPIDQPQNTIYGINSFIQILLWINDDSIFNNIFDISFETNNNWNFKGAFTYSRKGKNSVISALAGLVFQKTKDMDFDISRKDSFNFSAGSHDNELKQQYEYNHIADTNFLTHFTISTGIGCTFTHIENKNTIISLNYSIGGKLTF